MYQFHQMPYLSILINQAIYLYPFQYLIFDQNLIIPDGASNSEDPLDLSVFVDLFQVSRQSFVLSFQLLNWKFVFSYHLNILPSTLNYCLFSIQNIAIYSKLKHRNLSLFCCHTLTSCYSSENQQSEDPKFPFYL